MARKAAVVIGVDQTGDLAKLKSAAVGAQDVADWLRGEGYHVECLTDAQYPVRGSDVVDAVTKFVTDPPRYELILVYFSGHGYWHIQTDQWLLSGAPTNPNEAVNLDGTMDLAKYSGIPNVIFISDVCRSLPNSRSGAFINGIIAFPNHGTITSTSRIDYFKATGEARVAYEVRMGGSQNMQSVLTRALRSAYEEAEPDMVRQIIENGKRITVVPNRKLENYLQKKVDNLLAAVDINLTQQIETNVSSNDDVFIARATVRAEPPRRGARRGGPGSLDLRTAPAWTSGQDVVAAIARTLATAAEDFAEVPDVRLTLAGNAAMESKVESLLPSTDVDRFETGPGITVLGARVIKAVATKGKADAEAVLLDEGDGLKNPAIIRLHRVQPAVSVAIELDDGCCAVIAVLSGYISHASFAPGGLMNVSYVPSAGHDRWRAYERKRSKIDRLRALVAIAVAENTFRIQNEIYADTFGRTIRMENATDPSLGLYAAHAYSEAGKDDCVRSVLDHMRGDLNVDLFDVRALASRKMDAPWCAHPHVPFCPMLTRTWNRLPPRGIVLPSVLSKAIPFLCDSLWTTFQPDYAPEIIEGIERGEL